MTDEALLAVTRFRVADSGPWLDQARQLLPLLTDAGAISATVARATDDPGLYSLVSRWHTVGDYRRALGRVDVRMLLLPMSMTAIDEPGSYEPVLVVGGHGEPAGAVRERATVVVDGEWISARESMAGDWPESAGPPAEGR